MEKITNKELTDKGICPTCYDREHNHIVFGDNKTQMLYERAYQRENRRLFGDIQFDYIYNFEEGFNYWSNLYEIMKKNSI